MSETYDPTPGEYDHRGIDCLEHGQNVPHRRKKGETGSFECVNCLQEQLLYKQFVVEGEQFDAVMKDPIAPIFFPDPGLQAQGYGLQTKVPAVIVDRVLESRGVGPGGKKNDAGKDRFDLLPLVILRGVAKVLTFGAKVYADNSWQKVPEGLQRYRAAQERHFHARIVDDEELAEDSGLHHAYHYVTNAMFVGWLMIFRPEQVKAYRESQL